jgi:hypothetical protein
MDPQSQNQGSFEAPHASNANRIPAAPTAEEHPAAPEKTPAIGAPIPTYTAQTQASPPAAAPVFQHSPVPPPAASAIATPAVADDLDLIEKEWVEKAKAIVAKTRSDPYNQNKEMNRFKADYMQKRYGKEIKLDEK